MALGRDGPTLTTRAVFDASHCSIGGVSFPFAPTGSWRSVSAAPNARTERDHRSHAHEHHWSHRQERCARGSLVEYSICDWKAVGRGTTDAATGDRSRKLGSFAKLSASRPRVARASRASSLQSGRPPRDRAGGLASGGADLKDTRIRCQSSNQLKVIKEFRRIAGSDPVVELWHLIEGGSSLRCAHVLHLLQHEMKLFVNHQGAFAVGPASARSAVCAPRWRRGFVLAVVRACGVA